MNLPRYIYFTEGNPKMKLKIKPIVKQFTLDFDVEAKSTVTIRQIKTGDLVQLGDLFSEQTQVWDDEDFGQVQLKRKWNAEELKQERAYRTLVGLDLTVEESGESWFRFKEGKNGPELDMSRAAFIERWGLLDPALANEIYKFVVEVNPVFDPSASGE